ncbi:arginine-tRNA-protein transferase [Syncephalastrum racemosum]|uniref:Arginyl-tRNA--protein transferase 1 n=1 Tax=Syncephalastrum racemosum TaxID=13706 RepID=A0A1X2HT94_SYNRA|nr:arginine-tRNA-protein transferase [Syncephalastrum racemosum]
MVKESLINLLPSHGPRNCGYCHTNKSSNKYGFWAQTLTSKHYQLLIDQGWRRSGKFLYKPNLKTSCCSQYTLRVNARDFKPKKSQKKIVIHFNRYVEGTWHSDKGKEANRDGNASKRPKMESIPSTINAGKETLLDKIHAPEGVKQDFRHRLQIILEPASYADDKFKLFRKYQVEIHQDPPSKPTPESFKRFLVDSPLETEELILGDGKTTRRGSYHQRYMMDGQLIAVAVLDFLPKGVSSVYFFYDPDYSFLGLGNYSALREISLVQELEQRDPGMVWYYMGFYIHTCPKMSYKSHFRPAELLDPVTYDWYAIQDCLPPLEHSRYVVFSKLALIPTTRGDLPGQLDPDGVQLSNFDNIRFRIHQRTFSASRIMQVAFQDPHERQQFIDKLRLYVAAVGPILASKLIVLS